MKTDTRNKSMPAGQRSLAVLLPTLLACGMAMGEYVPPDRYGDAHTGATVLRQNKGQVHDTEGNLRPDVVASFEGSPVGIYLRDSSRVSFTYSMMYQDSMVADTVHRVDMQVGKAAGPLVIGIPVTPASKPVKPGLLLPAPGMSNYYRGPNAVEQVPAFFRGTYKDVLKDTDLHLYGSSGGPRMAFVIRP